MLVNISMHLPETNFCYVADKSCPLDTLFYLFSYTPALPNVAVCFVQCQFLWKRLSNIFFRKDSFNLKEPAAALAAKEFLHLSILKHLKQGLEKKKQRKRKHCQNRSIFSKGQL